MKLPVCFVIQHCCPEHPRLALQGCQIHTRVSNFVKTFPEHVNGQVLYHTLRESCKLRETPVLSPLALMADMHWLQPEKAVLELPVFLRRPEPNSSTSHLGVLS